MVTFSLLIGLLATTLAVYNLNCLAMGSVLVSITGGLSAIRVKGRDFLVDPPRLSEITTPVGMGVGEDLMGVPYRIQVIVLLSGLIGATSTAQGPGCSPYPSGICSDILRTSFRSASLPSILVEYDNPRVAGERELVTISGTLFATGVGVGVGEE